MNPVGRRITVELEYVLPQGAEQHLENAFDVFFEVVESAIKKQFNDYFCKSDHVNRRVRMVALLTTSATTVEEASVVVRDKTKAINKEIEEQMDIKMGH